ncbi:MAG: hypothetical protein LAT68_00695 [Cyclobacteriaceae bacterium]|nr:hypothetical protein [Cyclobacteriaceae bacterium]MCH8514821.1 hypothetical protein [Cyclobacteriaceae bacterium]
MENEKNSNNKGYYLPEGYFEAAKGRTINRLSEEKEAKKSAQLFRWPAVMSAAASVAILIGVWTFVSPSSNEYKDSNGAILQEWVVYFDGNEKNDPNKNKELKGEERAAFFKKLEEIDELELEEFYDQLMDYDDFYDEKP